MLRRPVEAAEITAWSSLAPRVVAVSRLRMDQRLADDSAVSSRCAPRPGRAQAFGRPGRWRQPCLSPSAVSGAALDALFSSVQKVPGLRLSANPVLEIGGEGDPAREFVAIGGVGLMSDGRVVVGDAGRGKSVCLRPTVSTCLLWEGLVRTLGSSGAWTLCGPRAIA